MTMSSIQACTCRALKDHSESPRHMVILAAEEHIPEIQRMLAASLEGGQCYGSLWKNTEGKSFSVHRYQSDPKRVHQPFDLVVCNGGEVLSAGNHKGLEQWRALAHNEL
jgi:hypothetical protein